MDIATRRLCSRAAIALRQQAEHIEALGCTCPTTDDRNRLHAPSRRRRDSRCPGVARAVEHRRVIRQLEQVAHAKVRRIR